MFFYSGSITFIFIMSGLRSSEVKRRKTIIIFIFIFINIIFTFMLCAGILWQRFHAGLRLRPFGSRPVRGQSDVTLEIKPTRNADRLTFVLDQWRGQPLARSKNQQNNEQRISSLRNSLPWK